jgi:xanthine dehydrogenase iron-sulfur cluster and FAD-binding subunit A
MKPAPFTYHAPRTLAEALVLAATQDNARVLAGGQSLMPLLNLRLAAPDHLIDLGRVDELVGIEQTAAGLAIGAMTTQRAWSARRSCVPAVRCSPKRSSTSATRRRAIAAPSAAASAISTRRPSCRWPRWPWTPASPSRAAMARARFRSPNCPRAT